MTRGHEALDSKETTLATRTRIAPRARIGVAMCTYNGTAFLREQLDSIAAQTRLPDLLTIVDDQSTDGTVRVLESFAADAPFPVEVVVNGENLGYARNFARAISLCDADIVVLSDQDDVWVPEKLGKVEAAFAQAPQVGVLFTDADVVDMELRPLGYTLWEAVQLSVQRQEEFLRGGAFERLLKGYWITGATMAFRGCFKDLILPVPRGTPHDAWIALIIAAVSEVGMIPEPLIKYRQHQENQIGIGPMGRLQSWLYHHRLGRTVLRDFLGRATAARERLRPRGVAPEKLRLLDRFIEHFSARVNLPDRRINRVKPISSELLKRRYEGSLGGLPAAVSDLLL